MRSASWRRTGHQGGMGELRLVADGNDEAAEGLAGTAALAMARFGDPDRSPGSDDHKRSCETRCRRARGRGVDEIDRLGDLRAGRGLDHDAILHQGRVQGHDRILGAEALPRQKRDEVGAPFGQRRGERPDRDAGRQGIGQFRRKHAIDEDKALRRRARRRRIPREGIQSPPRSGSARSAAPPASRPADRYSAKPRRGDAEGRPSWKAAKRSSRNLPTSAPPGRRRHAASKVQRRRFRPAFAGVGLERSFPISPQPPPARSHNRDSRSSRARARAPCRRSSRSGPGPSHARCRARYSRAGAGNG